MERRELLGVSTFLLSSGALIGLTQLSDDSSEDTDTECAAESIHNSTREVLSGQEWSRDFVVSEVNSLLSIRAISSNDQEIRLEVENAEEEIVADQTGTEIDYTNMFETFGVGEIRLYNTGNETQIATEDLWSNEVEILNPNAELSLWIQAEEGEDIVYDINTEKEGVTGDLDVKIENESGEILKEDTITTSGSGQFTPEESGRHYLRFTNLSESEIEWNFTFERNIEVGQPTDLTVEIVKGQGYCSLDSIESTFSEITSDI